MYTIYGKDNCPYCTQAEALLSSKGLSYQYVKVGHASTIHSELCPGITMESFVALFDEHGLSRPRTVPQIFLEGEGGVQYVGGFNQLKEMLDKTI